MNGDVDVAAHIYIVQACCVLECFCTCRGRANVNSTGFVREGGRDGGRTKRCTGNEIVRDGV